MITIRDLLIWYNNLDVRPMLEACLKQKEFYYTFQIYMYKDGFSLPSLSEKILYIYSIKGFDEYLKQKIPKPKEKPIIYSDVLKNKIGYYIKQDKKANGDIINFIDFDGFVRILEKHNYRCNYCWKELDYKTITLDRIDNSICHTESNCVLACEFCNTERKTMLYNKFLSRKSND